MKSCLRTVVALLWLLAALPAGAQCVREILLPVNDLAYDPFTRRIYATLSSNARPSGNSVIWIEPSSGQIGPPVFVGSEPRRLAIAEPGGVLWVYLEGAAAVRRFDTVTQTPGLQFTLGHSYGPNRVEDMEAMPGRPETVAISKYNSGISPRHVHVSIYDHGVERPKLAGGANVITFSDTGHRLYGMLTEISSFTFVLWDVDATGFVGGESVDYWIQRAYVDIIQGGGRIYANTGAIYDPDAKHFVGSIAGGLMRPDPRARRVYVLREVSGVVRLSAFDTTTFLEAWFLDIPNARGGVGSLIRWGEDGLAFCTGKGQVFLVDLSDAARVRPLAALGILPTTLASGTVATGTVHLAAPAPAGGTPVHLSSDDPAITVPREVIVPAGSSTTAFPVVSHAVPRTRRVTVTGETCGPPRSASVELLPVALPTVGANLLANGSFEAPDTASSPTGHLTFGPQGLAARPPTAPEIPGWRIVAGTVDVAAWPWNAADGRQSLDLFGDTPGAIEQSFPTELGRDYILSGWISHNPLNFTLPEARANLFLTGAPVIPLIHRDAGVTPSDMRWRFFSHRFRAAYSVTSLLIADATGTLYPGGLLLDGLEVAPMTLASAAGAPEGPTELSVRVLSPSDVELSWRDNSTSESRFAVWRRVGSGEWFSIAELAANVTRFRDNGVRPNRSYSYRVHAVNERGFSPASDPVGVTTLPGP